MPGEAARQVLAVDWRDAKCSAAIEAREVKAVAIFFEPPSYEQIDEIDSCCIGCCSDYSRAGATRIINPAANSR